MATIIDALVVQLGLDAKGLKQGASQAKGDLDSIEKSAAKTEKTVGGLGKGLVSLFALIGGATAIKALVQGFIEANGELERLSKNIAVNVSTITQWGNATERVGGTSQALYGTLSMLSKAQTQLRLTGESSLIPYFSMMGISMAGVGGKARTVTDELLDMASFAEGKDRPTMHNIFAAMGIDEGTINLLLTGRKELEITLARQKAYGDQLAKLTPAAARLQDSIVGLKQQFTLFGLGLLQDALPALESIIRSLERFGNWCQQNEEFIVDFLKVMAVGLIAVGVATAPINLTVVAVLALGAAIALLWQDYQTWERGGDSFIDWSKWEPGITAAQEAITDLDDMLQRFMRSMVQYIELAKNLHGIVSVKTGLFGVPEFSVDETKWNKVKQLTGDLYHDTANQGFAAPDPFDLNNKPKPLSADAGGRMAISPIVQYFQSKGWSRDQALGIASNVFAESKGDPHAIGDNGHAYGIAQWHKDRLDNMRRFLGKEPAQASLNDQLDFMQYELTQGQYKSAGNLLKQQTTAYGAGSTVSRAYEQPHDVMGEAYRRGTFAQSLAGIPGASAYAAPAGGGSAPQSVDNSRSISIASLTIHTQATDAAGIAQDFSSELDYLLASQANYGLVP